MPQADARPGEPATAAVFAALGDATRLDLVGRLAAASPQSISRLAKGSPLTRQAIAKHLYILESAGLVRSARAGRENMFEYRPESVDAARAYLARIGEQWEDALGRLKAFVES